MGEMGTVCLPGIYFLGPFNWQNLVISCWRRGFEPIKRFAVTNFLEKLVKKWGNKYGSKMDWCTFNHYRLVFFAF